MNVRSVVMNVRSVVVNVRSGWRLRQYGGVQRDRGSHR
jgi:hypothetical protein